MNLPAVIIPSYTNTSGLLKLLGQLKGYEGKIVVVDNKPEAAKSEKLKAQEIIYLPQTRNLGFAKGVNVGVKSLKLKAESQKLKESEWLAILNDDIVLGDCHASLAMTKEGDKGTVLVELAKYAEKMRWDAVSPILTKPTGEVENYGYTVLPIGKVELNNDPSTSSGRALDSSYLDGITAACLLIKKSVFDEMKGFDEGFFAYLEDVDLFLRMKRAGYTFGICTEISVFHEHMGTSGKMGWFKEKQDFKNWFRVIAKNWGTKKILLNLPGIVVERLRNLSGLLKKMIAS